MINNILLTINIKFAIEICGNIFFTIKAQKSIPPVEPFAFSINPIPIPSKTPPIIIAKKISSCTNDMYVVNSKKIESIVMPKTVFIISSFFKNLNPKPNKTMFKIKLVIDNGILKNYSKITPIVPIPPDDN